MSSQQLPPDASASEFRFFKGNWGCWYQPHKLLICGQIHHKISLILSPHTACDFVCSRVRLVQWSCCCWKFYEQHNFHRHDHQHHHLICSTTCTRPRHLIFPLSNWAMLKNSNKQIFPDREEEEGKKWRRKNCGRWSELMKKKLLSTARFVLVEARLSLVSFLTCHRTLLATLATVNWVRVDANTRQHEQCKISRKFSYFCTHFTLSSFFCIFKLK